MIMENPALEKIARQLFEVSPLKQRKLAMLKSMMDEPKSLRSLDIGSDNGVISMLLRELGGEWSSADLSVDTVEAIQGLVHERVFAISESRFPCDDAAFDQVLVVDLLEHVGDDRACIGEIRRVLKPGGTVVINVPNPRDGLVRRMRYLLGQTDAAHGHVRPGYTLTQLKALLGSSFEIERSSSYGRLFSELIDTAIVAGLDFIKGGKRGKKGKVVTADDLAKMNKSFRLYRLIAPLLRFVMVLDQLVPFMHGNMLIVRARRVN